nr:uncharacterized protein LOC127336039 [Lolium perenne]
MALVSSSNSLQILPDQDLDRSGFVELNQELGNEFLNETNWGILSCAMVIPREAIAKSWHSHTFTRCEQFRRRRRRSGIGQGFYLYLWEFLFDGVEEVQGQISQDLKEFDR